MTRQTKLLKYLRKRYREDPEQFVTQEEICRDIDEYELDLDPTGPRSEITPQMHMHLAGRPEDQ